MMDMKGLVKSLRQAQDLIEEGDEDGIARVHNAILGNLDRGSEQCHQIDKTFTHWTYRADSEPVMESSPIVRELWRFLS